jgi:hypothetical protein
LKERSKRGQNKKEYELKKKIINKIRKTNLRSYLDILHERQALAPLDDLVQPLVGDAAQTREQAVVVAGAVGSGHEGRSAHQVAG